jgi:hypothetical protein
VGDVPLVRPEKYASAIWQKRADAPTSVKGTVVVAPPQVPVSARISRELETRAASAKTNASALSSFVPQAIEIQLVVLAGCSILYPP